MTDITLDSCIQGNSMQAEALPLETPNNDKNKKKGKSKDEIKDSNKKKKKKKNKKKKKSQNTEKKDLLDFGMGISIPTNTDTNIDTAEIRKQWLKEKMRQVKEAKRGLRDPGDHMERVREKIAQATPEELQQISRFFNGSPECLNKFRELAAEAGVPVESETQT